MDLRGGSEVARGGHPVRVWNARSMPHKLSRRQPWP